MATQQLLDQFYQLLSQSKSFQLLDPVEQAEVKSNFTAVTDEQLLAAINELKADIEKTAKRELQAKQNLQQAALDAEKLDEEIKITEKEILKDDQKQDEENSAKAAEAIITDLGKKEEKKRKKWFGLF